MRAAHEWPDPQLQTCADVDLHRHPHRLSDAIMWLVFVDNHGDFVRLTRRVALGPEERLGGVFAHVAMPWRVDSEVGALHRVLCTLIIPLLSDGPTEHLGRPQAGFRGLVTVLSHDVAWGQTMQVA